VRRVRAHAVVVDRQPQETVGHFRRQARGRRRPPPPWVGSTRRARARTRRHRGARTACARSKIPGTVASATTAEPAAASGPPPRRSVTRTAIGRMAPRLQRAPAALELVVKRQCKERPEERSGEKRRRQGSRAESGRPEQSHVDQAPCDASAVPRQQPDEQHPGGERDERRARAQRRRSPQLRLTGSRRTAIARPLRR
jgi:hypothetical protein